MSVSDNRITKKGISILLIAALNMTGLFSCQNTAYADSVILSEEVYYHLDMGVQIAYNSGCDWGSDNIYGSSTPLPVHTTISFIGDIEVIDTYPLNSIKGSRFNFNGQTSSHNIPRGLGEASWAYNEYYSNYISTSMTEGSCSSSGKSVTFNYTVRLSTPITLEVVKYGEDGRGSEIYRLFGGKSALQKDQPEIAEAIETALEAGANGTAGTNKLYLIFCPNVIEYKKYITVGDLEAKLNLPSSAKQGETYPASDISLIDSSLTVEKAVVDKSIDGGAWQNVTTWPGTGKAGENTGGTIDQSCAEICTIRYRLTVTTKDGQTAEDIKTINIIDGKEISVVADLVLPDYTYEGHPTPAKDQSTFIVDGVNYSAKHAYAENLADSYYTVVPSSCGTAKALADITGEMTFYKKGTYDGKLTVRTKTGAVANDIEPIEVRATPYIIDNLGGFQKQNRKQILNIAVATYPGKPITDYYVELLDLKTGQRITLTEVQPQVNNATIKTRTMTNIGDEYWTNFTLEFLTKTPAYHPDNPEYTQEFRYTIYMKDSKGDTDTAQKTFTVKPDLPPNPQITIQDSFIRNKGTNTAEITTEDSSTTDGDQLERTWTTSGENLKNLPGYGDLSFGSGQKVKYSKTGVGKETIRLSVRDIWIEPTLEEYITNADYLSASITATTEVVNIAPVVSLEPISFRRAGISLLVNQNSKPEIEKKTNTIIAAMLEKGIDGTISIAPVAESYDGEPKLLMSKSWPAANVCTCGNCQTTGITDSEYTFIARRSQIYTDGLYDYCNGLLTVYAFKGNIDTGQAETVWSYTGGENEVFTISEDQTEKYILLHKEDGTILLNRNNGAYITTINKAIGTSPFVSEDGERMYVVEDSRIMKYDAITNTYTQAADYGGSSAQLHNGKIAFAGKESEYRYFIGLFDMTTEELKMRALPKFNIPNAPAYATSLPLTVVDMDAKGKLLLKAVYKDSVYSDLRASYCIYLDAQSGTAITESYGNLKTYPDWGFVRDETDKPVGIFRLHIAPGSSSNKIYRSLSYRDINENGTVGTERTLVSDNGDHSTNNIMYARKHTAENKIYIIQGTGENYTASGMYPYTTKGVTAVLDLNTNGCTVINSTAAFGGLSDLENGSTVNGNLMASTYHIWQISGGRAAIKQIRQNISKAQAEANAFDKFVKDRINDLVYSVQDAILDMDDLIKKTEDKIDTSTSVKVSVIGETGKISKKLNLEPNKTYYCEYSVKPLSTVGAVTVSTSQNTSKATSAENSYIVTDEKLDDFSSSAYANPFFTYSDKSKISNGWYSENITNKLNNNASARIYQQSSTIRFTVPSGKKAVLSFDYNINLAAPGGINQNIWQNGFLIDGERWSRTMASGSGHYTHPYMLSPGAHTITIFSQCYTATVYNHSTSMDNLSVAYIEPADKTTVLNAASGTTQQFVAPKDEKYRIKLYGPGSDSNGGLIEASLNLKKDDILTVYLGPQVPRATGLLNGANGVSGNGYGSEGSNLAKISVNGKTIAIAGGGGSNGNPGSGDGALLNTTTTLQKCSCPYCGAQWTGSTRSHYCDLLRIYVYFNEAYKYPCTTCGKKDGDHTHYYYNGTGGTGGVAGAGGASTTTIGTAGGNGSGPDRWVIQANNPVVNHFNAAGNGGSGGNGGASWVDATICSDIRITPSANNNQSKAILSESGNFVSTAYGLQEVIRNRGEDDWISGKTSIKTEPAVTGYSDVDYTPLNYGNAGSLITRSKTDGLNEQFTYTIPPGKISLLNQISPRLAISYHDAGYSFGYSYGSERYLKRGDSSDNTVPLFYIDSLYKFTQPQATGTHTFIGYGNQESNKYGQNGKWTYFENINLNLINSGSMNSQINTGRYFFDPGINRVVYANATSSNEKTVTLTFDNQGAGSGEYLIRDLKFYYLQNGKKVYVNETNNDISEYSKAWTASENVTIAGHIEPKAKEEEEAPLVYKKGQLVAYNIFYDDYEKDPSKKEYWSYTHTPFNDGPHPQAADILDEDGNLVSSTGAILAQSIPRFYIDGKYTVAHRQEDNTNRTGETSGTTDYTEYDKLSNEESITFYIEGGGSAPWVKSIKTVPGKVRENAEYYLQIELDDAEKDILRLTTEVYLDRKLIYTHKAANITANGSTGVYPAVLTGNPPLAAAGKYDVVCTVRDWTGAGIGSYRFTVVSEGKITGAVNHTDQWDDNRKKYNRKRFSDEINRTLVFSAYKALSTPRPRGTNVFWSGEKFMLLAETEGNPLQVDVQIMEPDPRGDLRNAGYAAELSKAGAGGSGTNGGGAGVGGMERWQGSVWEETMVNRWGRKQPEELVFVFTATYSSGMTKTDQVRVIIDSDRDYWQLHRLW